MNKQQHDNESQDKVGRNQVTAPNQKRNILELEVM